MMKKLSVLLFCLFTLNLLSAQQKFTVPELTKDQKSEVLYSHVMAYLASGVSYAKSQGTTAEDYGKFIGKKFTAYWDPSGGFPVLVNRMMFILAGLHPDNQMEIVEQDENSITFRLKNVDLSFQNGAMLGVTYEDFLSCSYGVIYEVADFMKCNFSHKMTDDGWYVVNLSKKS